MPERAWPEERRARCLSPVLSSIPDSQSIWQRNRHRIESNGFGSFFAFACMLFAIRFAEISFYDSFEDGEMFSARARTHTRTLFHYYFVVFVDANSPLVVAYPNVMQSLEATNPTTMLWLTGAFQSVPTSRHTKRRRRQLFQFGRCQ